MSRYDVWELVFASSPLEVPKGVDTSSLTDAVNIHGVLARPAM
ncbi:MAG: hypothetical protein QW680_09880 [Pyrobaculum sp.]